MAHSQNLNITLSDETVAFIRSKVASGEYASESDVLQEGIETLKHLAEERESWERDVLIPPHDLEMERWLHEVGGPRHDSFHANPSSGVSIDQVERNLEERRKQRANTIREL